jgi:hypothetical protein
VVDARERFERQRYFTPDWGVGYAFGETKPVRGETHRLMDRLPEDYRQALYDPRTELTIYTMASRPGGEAHNLRLSQRRGEELAMELRAEGVRAEIRIEALGEVPARPRVSMSLRPPSDRDRADARDDARFRTAHIEITPHAGKVELTGKRIEGSYSPLERLDDDVEQGERIFREKIATPLGERVRELHKLPENPVAPDPSADPGEWLHQAEKISKDAAKNPFRTLGKFVVGSFYEMARDEWRKEVARQRRPLYESIAEGVASGLDPGFEPRAQPSGVRRELFDQAKTTVEGLSEKERDQLAFFLIESRRSSRLDSVGEARSYDYILQRMEGTSYKWAVVDRFGRRHFERE